jgi:negative regulator of genetic competence, sporulation and motility
MPFAHLPHYLSSNSISIFINSEDIDASSISFSNKDNLIVVKKECDDFFKEIVDYCDWNKQFNNI